MANRTISKLLGFHFVRSYQFQPENTLVLCRNVLKIIDFALGTDELLRFPVTIEAPLHMQCVGTPCQRHLVDVAVTYLARHTFVHVNAMIEIGKIRKVMHPNPLEWLEGLVARAYRLQ